ncbi:MAG: DoxX family protein [Ferruginibacter sp.]
MNVLRWTVQVLIAAAFLAAGAAKLAGDPSMVAVFDQVGIGQWFRNMTGAVEITGAVLILVPKAAIFGAALLACTMAAAVLTHLAVIGGNPLPAIVLLSLNLLVLWLRRDEVSARLAR